MHRTTSERIRQTRKLWAKQRALFNVYLMFWTRSLWTQRSVSGYPFVLHVFFYAELRHTKPDNGECALCMMSCTKTQITAVSCVRSLAAVCLYVHFSLVTTLTQLGRIIPIFRCNTWATSVRCCQEVDADRILFNPYMWAKWLLCAPCCLLKVHSWIGWTAECVCVVEQRPPSWWPRNIQDSTIRKKKLKQ